MLRKKHKIDETDLYVRILSLRWTKLSLAGCVDS